MRKFNNLNTTDPVGAYFGIHTKTPAHIFGQDTNLRQVSKKCFDNRSLT